jgi:hypothetical protein
LGTALKEDCRFASFSDRKFRRPASCLLDDKKINQKICRQCPRFDPGELDVFDILSLPADTKDMLMCQMPDGAYRFRQEVEFVLPFPADTPIGVVALLLSEDDSLLFAELVRLCERRKGKELVLRYRGDNRIYFAAAGEIHVGGKRFVSSAIRVQGYREFP